MLRLGVISGRFLTVNLQKHFSDTKVMRAFLKRDLYSLCPIIKNVNLVLLGQIYSPGVGSACLQIHKNPKMVDQLTFRARTVAIVSSGQMLDCQPKQFQFVMDWIIVQLKHDGGLDAVPVLIDRNADIKTIFQDLSKTYGTILYLDKGAIPQIPEDLLVVQHHNIAADTKDQITSFHKTAKALAYLINKKVKGAPSIEKIRQGYTFQTENFETNTVYPYRLKDQTSNQERSLRIHRYFKGKLHIELNFRDITPIRAIFTEKNIRSLIKEGNVECKTSKLCVIASDGTAVLGYGNIGPSAALPVMEGKSQLFWTLGDSEVVPLVFNPRKSAEQTIKALINIVKYYRAVNLQDIKAPECFDIESGLEKLKLLPVFHDDQHGTAIVTLGALINAAILIERDIKKLKCIINGAGAAGITIAKLLYDYGVQNIIVCDTAGIIYKGRTNGMNAAKKQVAEFTNLQGLKGNLQDALKGADVFIGVSVAGALKGEWIRKMTTKPIIFAMANPIPEIMPQEAKKNGAFIYGSGRSDLQNQINNSLVFPGIFRGIIQHKITNITPKMKICAAQAIAKSLVGPPTPDYIVPDSLDKDVAIRISDQIGKLK